MARAEVCMKNRSEHDVGQSALTGGRKRSVISPSGGKAKGRESHLYRCQLKQATSANIVVGTPIALYDRPSIR